MASKPLGSIQHPLLPEGLGEASMCVYFLFKLHKLLMHRRGNLSCQVCRTQGQPFLSSLPNAGATFHAKSAERRGRSCAGPQIMFDIFFKRGWDIFYDRHKTDPCETSVTFGTCITLLHRNGLRLLGLGSLCLSLVEVLLRGADGVLRLCGVVTAVSLFLTCH